MSFPVSLREGRLLVSAVFPADKPDIADLLAIRCFAGPAAQAGGSGSEVGQWVATFASDAWNWPHPAPSNTAKLVQSVLSRQARRSGLLPTSYPLGFLKRLRSERPICLVTDTSALVEGSLERALELRGGLPVHLVVPDQVFMELQRQRERYDERKRRPDHDRAELDVRLRARLVSRRRWISGVMSLRRIRRRGVIVHYARPPEALVRFFGSGQGGSTDDECSCHEGDEECGVAPNFQRDRLILEALREQRRALPDVEPWLLTEDARFASQAALEGFRAALAWQQPYPEPLMFGSPYIEPCGLVPGHRSLESFLRSLLWRFPRVRLQYFDEAAHWDLALRKSLRLLSNAELENVAAAIHCEQGRSPRLRPAGLAVSSPSAGRVRVPSRAPTAEALVNGLICLRQDSKALASLVGRSTPSYLVGLGWVGDKVDGLMRLTSRGEQLARDWQRIKPEDAAAVYEWLSECRKDFFLLQPIEDLVSRIRVGSPTTQQSLLTVMEVEKSALRSRIRLGCAMGLLVETEHGIWRTKPHAGADLRTALMSKLRREMSSATLFAHLVREGVSLPAFRMTINELWRSNEVAFSGSAPDASTRTLVALLPTGDGKARLTDVDLSAGDFLVPTQSTQSIRPVREVANG